MTDRWRSTVAAGIAEPEPIASWAFVGVLIVAPQLLGGATAWGVAAIALGCALCLSALAVQSGLAMGRDAARAGAVFALAMAFTALQGMPLPCAWVAALHPTAADLQQSAASLLGTDGYCALTYDPGATREEIVKGGSLLAALAVGWLLARRRRGNLVFGGLAVSAIALAAVTLAHWAVGADKVFGLYEPVFFPPGARLSPVLNPNNLGGLLAASVPLVWACAWSDRERQRRLLWFVGLAMVVAVAMLSLSRGANGILLAGILWCAYAATKAAPGEPLEVDVGLRRALATLAVVTVGAALAVALGLDPLLAELSGGGSEKLQLAMDGLSLGAEHAWLGVGRGAFSAAFVAQGRVVGRAEYAENFVVQWLAEWGVVVGGLVLIGMAWTYRAAWWRAKSRLHAAALVALALAAVQNLVDLGFELSGIAVPWAAVLGASVGVGSSAARRPLLNGDRSAWAIRGVAAAVVLSLLLVPGVIRDRGQGLRERLTAQIEKQDREGFAKTLKHAVASHPSEPIFSVLAAEEALDRAPGDAGPWINRSMRLAPGWPAPHLHASRWLWQQGRRDQAMLELAESARRDPKVSAQWGCKLTQAPALLKRAVPDTPEAQTFLDVLGACLPPLGPARREMDAMLRERFPDTKGGYLREVRALVQDKRFDDALALSQALLKRQPQEVEARVAELHVLTVMGQASRAVEKCAEVGDSPERWKLLRVCARAHAAAGDAAAMRQAIKGLRAEAAGDLKALAAAESLHGHLELQLGHPTAALRAFEYAHEIVDDEASLRDVATTAIAAGARGRAYRAYSQLCAQGGPDSVECTRRKELDPTRPQNLPSITP